MGDTVQSGGNYGRYQIDMSKGFLLFADESGETWPGYASSFLFTDKVLTDAEVAALGGVKASGIMDTKPSANSVQIDFGNPAWPNEFGAGNAQSVTFDAAGTEPIWSRAAPIRAATWPRVRRRSRAGLRAV